MVVNSIFTLENELFPFCCSVKKCDVEPRHSVAYFDFSGKREMELLTQRSLCNRVATITRGKEREAKKK